MQSRHLSGTSRLMVWMSAVVFAVLQTACGGSGTDTVALTVPVFAGLPVNGSTVTLKGSNGVSVSVTNDATTNTATFKASQIFALGNPPYLVKSTGGKTDTGNQNTPYYSIATAATGRVNVTPITHLIAVNALNVADTTAMNTLFSATGQSGFDAAKAAQASGAIATALANVKAELQKFTPPIDIGTDDPRLVTFAFKEPHDLLLDDIQRVIRGNANVTIDTIQANITATTTTARTPLISYKRLVVFGDSLSDGGAYTRWAAYSATNNQNLVGTGSLADLATAANFGGKFTTNPGKVWVENLAAAVGYDLKPANLMGGGMPSVDLTKAPTCTTCTNYAQGGARVALQPGIGNTGTTANPANQAVAQIGFAGNSVGAAVAANPVLLSAAAADYKISNAFLGASTLPVMQQIDQHLASTYVTNGNFAATDLVIVLAGANDVFTQAGLAGAGAITQNAAVQAVGLAAGELAKQVARLKTAGAKHVLVVGLPDMGNTPAGVAQGAAAAGALTQLSQSVFNATLTGGLASVPGVAYLDPVPLFSDVVATPSKYGFTKVIDSTALPGSAIASTACGPNAIAQQAAGDSATSPSSLFCSVANTTLSILGTLRTALADQTYVFADSVHPTTNMHKVLSDYAQQKMGLLLSNAYIP